jgi:hypothetical protein
MTRRHTAGTLASSGATAMIASCNTSRKGGRAGARPGEAEQVATGIDLAWWGG